MTVRLTAKEFSQHVGTPFRVTRLPMEIDLTLVDVERYESKANEQKGLERFSVFFSGVHDAFLPQAIYHLQHEQMGEFEIFIVPIAREDNCYRYEAVFNYSIQT